MGLLTHFSKSKNIVAFFISLAFLTPLTLALPPLTSSDTCPYDLLPGSLNRTGDLDFNSEFHLQGTFFEDFSIFSRDILFNITQTSAFRFYVAPHSVDVDIWLYGVGNSTDVTHTSDVGGDESIFATIPPGNYLVRLLFFGSYKMNGVQCPIITIEVAIVPTSRIRSRQAGITCPPNQQLPTIPFVVSTSAGYTYDTDVNSPGTVFNVQDNPGNRVPQTTLSWLQSYPFTLPANPTPGGVDVWEVTVTLTYDFITGGSLGVLLQSTLDPAPTDFSCLDKQNCSLGSHSVLNENTLQTTLPAGGYTLYLFDAIGEKDFSLSTCNPFSLRVNIKHLEIEESFLNCQGQFLPSSFNNAGYLDDTGFMYYRSPVIIDLSNPREYVSFRLSSPSLFRAYTPNHRIDIDLQLINADTRMVVAYTYQWGGEEEGLLASLDANINYNFTVIYYGRYSPQFCETFFLEVAISPTSLYSSIPNYCTNAPLSLPNLSGIQSALNNGGTFQIGEMAPPGPNAPPPSPTIYNFNFAGNYGQRSILTQNFTVNQPSLFSSEIGVNFLLGDIRIWLITGVSGAVELGSHRRNSHFINVAIQPGTYSLVFVTGDSQSTQAPAGFPSCVPFTFKLTIAPQTPSFVAECFAFRPFPHNLNTPAYLSTSPKIHIQETFLVPTVTLISNSENTYFTVAGASFFRLYTEPHHIDIDITLFENGTQRTNGISFNDEEVITWNLVPFVQYRILFRFYHWFFGEHGDEPPCYSYNVELAIVPAVQRDNTSCPQNNIPPSNLIPIPTANPWESQAEYWFTEGSRAFSTIIPFRVPGPLSAYFRAIATYDFVSDDVEIEILTNTTSPVQTQLTYGIIDYNGNEIAPILIPPGSYILRIYQPVPSNYDNNNWRGCVHFGLHLGFQLFDPSQNVDPNVGTVCGAGLSDLPFTLNSAGYLSALTGQIVDFQRDLVVDTALGTATFQFTLSTPSLFKIYTPPHSNVDVDIYLLHGTVANPGLYIDFTLGLSEEELYHELLPGDYFIQFAYFGYDGVPISSLGCTTFRLLLSIYPTNYLEAIQSLTDGSCVTQVLPSQVQGTRVYNTYTRRLDQSNFAQTLSFTLSAASQFTMGTFFSDSVNLLSASLTGSIQDGTNRFNHTYYPLTLAGRQYLNEILLPGSYTLTIHDPIRVPAPDAYLVCAQWSIYYYFNSTIDVPPQDTCNSDEALPTDLFTPQGGSYQYGGPQYVDGSVRIFGFHFYQSPDPAKRHNYILINAPPVRVNPTPNFARIYAGATDGNDIDFILYKNASDLTSSLYSSMGWEAVESALWVLPPQSNPYLLDLTFFRVNPNVPCNYFTFGLAIKPKTIVQQELMCPNPLPNEINQVPPQSVTVPSGNVYDVSNEEYIFTKQRIEQNTRNQEFQYRMTITVETNATLSAELGFDFLANDYRLALSRVSGIAHTQIAQGSPLIPPNQDTYINFMNTLTFILSPGTYFLDIDESLWSKDFGLTDFCHTFSFRLRIGATGPNVPPYIFSVDPPNGRNLFPNTPLIITVTFSQPTGSSVFDYSSIYLLDTFGGPSNRNLLNATSASFDPTNRVLQLSFGPFSPGQFFSLVVDHTKFYSPTGIQFSGETNGGYHYYTFLNCNCNNHGTCGTTPGGEYGCICQLPWAGIDCSECVFGTHPAGPTCVANAFCTPHSCGNGTCDDSEGSVVCTCNIGFADSSSGAPCSACAPGYYSYPNCTKYGEVGDRDTNCDAPLLPSTLNAISYLIFDGRTHLQDSYYIDTDEAQHDTTFTIYNTSLIRVYSEPHWVDIDLWLYLLNSDGSIAKTIDYGISFSEEEVLLDTIDPGNYLLRFKYYFWDTNRVASCETFNLELAIAQLPSVIDQVSKVDTCLPNSVLPTLPGTTPGQRAIWSAPFTFSPSTTFTVNRVTTSGANFFWRQDFTIPPTTNTSQIAVLFAYTGFKFLPGEVAFMLESKSNADHCANEGFNWLNPVPSSCSNGWNRMNENMILGLLRPGNYTLWMYEPVPQLASVSSCSSFSFYINLSWVDDEIDIYNCDATVLPASLDTPEFTGGDGFVHILDNYLLNNYVSKTNFTISQRSALRVSFKSTFAVTLGLVDSHGNQIPSSISTSTLFADIQNAGTYTITFTTTELALQCPDSLVEIAIEPVTFTLAKLPNCFYQTTIPTITNLRAPFSFGVSDLIPAAFYALPATGGSNALGFAAYLFTVTEPAFLDASVSSNFLRGDIRVSLYTAYNGNAGILIATGDPDYNNNRLQVDLQTGTYVLQIERPPVGVAGSTPSLPRCAEYNFAISVQYITGTGNNNPNSGLAPACDGEHLPLSFNKMHFLGLDGRMHYQSNQFIIPPQSNMFQSDYIFFTVSNTSLIRVYTEPHTYIDIDIKLRNNVTNELYTSGTNNIKDEESFTYIVQPGVPYVVEVQYWFWNSVPSCSTFNMEFAIGPVVIPSVICPGQGGSRWPPIFTANLPTTPFSYNSLQRGITMYFQQSTSGPKSSSYSLNLRTPANLHIEVGYDFLRGSLSMQLTSSVTAETFYGTARPNRNVLNLQNLPAGSYQLTIAEPILSVEQTMGCNYFTYQAYIDPFFSFSSTPWAFPLPQTLDALPYLVGDGGTHLSSKYSLFAGGSDSTNFTIHSGPSILRIEAVITDNDNEGLVENYGGVVLAPTIKVSALPLTGAAPIVNGFGSVLVQLNPGSYLVQFGKPLGFTLPSGGVVTSLELSVSPSARLGTELATFASTSGYPKTCQNPANNNIPNIVTNPSGFFVYHSDYQLVPASQSEAQNVVLSRRFTLDRQSFVYIHIGYVFSVNNLDVELNSSTTTVFARKARNLKEMNTVIPSGTYDLTIFQPSLWPASFNLDHCLVYSITIVILDSSLMGQVCPNLYVAPFDLSSVSGGSLPYGGPISGSGELHLFGAPFLIPRQPIDPIAFKISEASMLSVLFFEFGNTFMDIQLSSPQGQNIEPVANQLSRYQAERLTLYSVPSAGSYSLNLTYSDLSTRTCPAFGLQIDLKPVSTIIQDFTCPTSLSPVFPSSVVPRTRVPGVHGEVVQSYFPLSFLESGVFTRTSFNYPISFSITQNSHLYATISYSSLVSYFKLSISSLGNFMNSAGQWAAQQIGSGGTTISQVLDLSLRPGNYTLNITAPYLGINNILHTEICLPFIYTIQILPDSGVPYLAVVNPSGGLNLNPQKDLLINIQFNTLVYTSTNASVWSSQSYLLSVVLLAGSDGSTLTGTSVQSIGNNGYTYTITFPAYKLKSTISYRLQVSQLFDVKGTPLVFLGYNTYSMIDTSCSNSGTFLPDTGECACQTGYTGYACDDCASGFHNNAPLGRQVVCVSTACEQNTCGCDPNYPAECIPLGKCEISGAGYATCTCTTGYTGQYCSQCANGYTGYPYCKLSTQCPVCVHGACNVNTGTCVCPENFSGPTCETCASGFSGTDCSEYTPGGSKPALIYIEVTAVIVFVAIVAAFAIWFVRRKRTDASRYRMLPRFGDDEEEGLPGDEDDDPKSGQMHRLPAVDNQLTEEHDPSLAAEMHSRAEEREQALSSPSSPSTLSPSPLNIQDDDVSNGSKGSNRTLFDL